jgi:glycosyltransferase involved in cell wall biosynthesis
MSAEAARPGDEPAPLRVAHMVWGAGIGGIERFVSDLARVQASSPGIQVSVMACGAQAGDPSLARYVSPGVAVYAGELRSGVDSRLNRLAAMADELPETDVIHLHGYNPVMGLLTRRAGLPVVFTEHGMLGLDCEPVSRESLKQLGKGLYLRRRVCVVACVSEWVAQAARRRYAIDVGRIRVVPDGLDFERIRPRSTREDVLRGEAVDPSAFVLVVTARLVDSKRIDRLLDGCALMRRDGRPWTLLVVGDGPLGESLRQRALALGLADNVRFLGFRDRVWDLVGAADVVALPSSREAFGLAVVEAMALGRPVVAFSDSGGPAEIVERVGGGCLVDTVEALGPVLDRLRDGTTPEGLQPLDRARLASVFSIERSAATYADLYRAALLRRPER